MQIHVSEHLTRSEKIKLGGYYTPKKIVNKVYHFIEPYLLNNKKDIIIFDSTAGCGAFLTDIKEKGFDYRAADFDSQACSFLKQYLDKSKVFHTNSLFNVSRKKYKIPSTAFLIVIGNPPYNDTTSEFKKGDKGKNICDKDLFDRDLGISFLKSYNKLKANVVCILHPLSYLIKEANFKRLYDFKDNYKLIKGEIFPSSLFYGTSSVNAFPILVALYERNTEGMTFDYIKHFQFNVLDMEKKFVLSSYNTTDGYINKYPPRKYDIQESPIGLYYNTFRDFNSLKRNTAFMINQNSNGIVVTLENFYKYAYLYALKNLFKPENAWLYGNLSPLVNIDDLENNKKLYVLYALKTNRVLKEIENSIRDKILNYYKIDINYIDYFNELEIESKIRFGFMNLI